MVKCHLMSVLQQRDACSRMTEIFVESAHTHGSLSQ